MSERSRFEHVPKPEGEGPTPKLELTLSRNGLPAIQVMDPHPEVRRAIKRLLASNDMRDPDYQRRQKVKPYLQADYESNILVEFWTGTPEDHQEYVDYVNESIRSGRGKE